MREGHHQFSTLLSYLLPATILSHKKATASMHEWSLSCHAYTVVEAGCNFVVLLDFFRHWWICMPCLQNPSHAKSQWSIFWNKKCEKARNWIIFRGKWKQRKARARVPPNKKMALATTTNPNNNKFVVTSQKHRVHTKQDPWSQKKIKDIFTPFPISNPPQPPPILPPPNLNQFRSCGISLPREWGTWVLVPPSSAHTQCLGQLMSLIKNKSSH
jgi:hypothetical protein